MIVYDLDVVGVSAPPTKANAPLIVNPNTVLALAVADEFLQTIGRRNPKIVYRTGSVQDQQLSQGYALYRAELPGTLPKKHFLGFLAAESLDHALIITHGDIIVKRY